MFADMSERWRLEHIWLDGMAPSSDDEALWGGTDAKERGEDVERSLTSVVASRDEQIIAGRQLVCGWEGGAWDLVRLELFEVYGHIPIYAGVSLRFLRAAGSWQLG